MSKRDESTLKYSTSADMGVVEPSARVKHLANYGNSVEVDFNVPIRRYYRSGNEMVRMANVYQQEGSLENAYILYMKFMTLFIEKIRKHPEYGALDANFKKTNQAKLHEIMPKAESLKAHLINQYTKEYKKFLEDQTRKQIEIEQRLKRDREQKRKDEPTIKPLPRSLKSLDNGLSSDVSEPKELIGLDSVVYPDDFHTEQNRPNLPDGLVLPPSPLMKSAGPSVDRTSKPVHTSLFSGVFRTVIVPSALMDRFLALAKTNTDNNIETCGILAGYMAYNQLTISHVILPKQQGTSDSCTTMNEEDIFDFQDQQNLITLGWIHTHPSQTAFLSSVDLHTHCSYQTMMPEALAIVCAPKYKETGFFCLTPQYGLDYISQCRQSGFHPHPNEPPLFMTAPHIKVDPKTVIDVVDLR